MFGISLCSAASLGFLMCLQNGQQALILSTLHGFSIIQLIYVNTCLPTSRYVWILLVVFQLLMTNVSLLGHLCGILSGYACKLPRLLPNMHYLYSNTLPSLYKHNCCLFFFELDIFGLFNILMPGPSFYSSIEESSLLVSLVRKLIAGYTTLIYFFILCSLMHFICNAQNSFS